MLPNLSLFKKKKQNSCHCWPGYRETKLAPLELGYWIHASVLTAKKEETGNLASKVDEPIPDSLSFKQLFPKNMPQECMTLEDKVRNRTLVLVHYRGFYLNH
jgi:hypothetical protein